MFVIITYDIEAKRVSKVMKICRKYLKHVQRSVFEGMLTEAKLEKLKWELKRTVDTQVDSIYIYRIESMKYTSKEIIGSDEQMDSII